MSNAQSNESAKTPPPGANAKPAVAKSAKGEGGKKTGDVARKSAKSASEPEAKARDADAVRYAFVVANFSRKGTESEAYAVEVVHELARRGRDVLVVTSSGKSGDERVRLKRSNPLIMGRKAIQKFAPHCIVDWGYNIPANVRRVDSPAEQIFQHKLNTCSTLTKWTEKLKAHFCKRHRCEVRNQKALLDVSKTRFIAPSKHVATDLKAAGVSPSRISVLPYGVDLTRFSPDLRATKGAEFRKSHGFNDSHILFMADTNHPRLRDLALLESVFLEATKQNPNIRLLLFGEYLPAWQHSWFKHVADIKETEAAFAGADAFVHPAVYDPCAPGVLQAMATGLPVLTTKDIGSAKLVRKSGGATLLSLAGDGADGKWTKAVLELASDEELRQQRGSAARQAVAQRTLESFVDELETILRDGT